MRRFTDATLAKLESEGVNLSASRFFSGTFYKPDKQGLTVYTEKCGDLQVDWKNIDDLIEELMDFQEVYGK